MSADRSTDLRIELSQRVLLCDGAMGTQLILRGLPVGVCGETWNLDNPQAVEAIHRAYREAGCDLLTTNTFGATTTNLERHHLAEKAHALNVAGAQLARRAAGDSAWVLGDIGPFGGFLEPLGETTEAQLLAIFRAQAEGLREGGADGIIIETMGDPAEVSVAIRAAKEVTDWPVIATYAFAKAEDGSFRTLMGTRVGEAMAAAAKAGADIIGANCGTALGLPEYIELAKQLVAAARPSGTGVILQPNAGAPQMIDGKMVHPATPQEMAALVHPFIDAGLRIIGGCCGTTPEHLRAMAAKLKD